MKAFTVLHGGGRGTFGPVGRLFGIGSDLRVFVVEADLKGSGMGRFGNNAERILHESGVEITVVSGCLWHTTGQIVEFYINHMPGSSGLFPISEFAKNFKRMSGNGRDVMVWKDVCKVEKTVMLETVTVDELIKRGQVDRPDVISLDIQGAEYMALSGAAKALKDAVCVITEAEYVPLYKGQPLFHDIAAKLWGHGFFFAGRETEEEWFEGTIGGRGFISVTEAIFLRDYKGLDFTQRMKLAYTAGAFGFLGYACQIVQEAVDKEHDEWERFLAASGMLGRGVADIFSKARKAVM